MKSQTMSLYFVKKINSLKKKGKTDQPNQHQDKGQHDCNVLIIRNQCISSLNLTYTA
jgi:hypothetical protein